MIQAGCGESATARVRSGSKESLNRTGAPCATLISGTPLTTSNCQFSLFASSAGGARVLRIRKTHNTEDRRYKRRDCSPLGAEDEETGPLSHLGGGRRGDRGGAFAG